MVQTRHWTSFSNLLSGLDNEVLAADGVHDDRRSSGARPGLELGVRGLPPLLVRNSLGNATYSRKRSKLDENLQEVRHSLGKEAQQGEFVTLSAKCFLVGNKRVTQVCNGKGPSQRTYNVESRHCFCTRMN